jgi:predicted nucleic acid-binding protein
MKVLVDTSIWSKALRRDEGHNQAVRKQLGDLIAGHRAEIIGPIRQEILSGIRDGKQFDELNAHLSAFPDLPIIPDDYVTAARLFNLCRQKGIQGSNTDHLICAVAIRNRQEIFTADKDFKEFAKVLPISLTE